jgi:hypothetical protein
MRQLSIDTSIANGDAVLRLWIFHLIDFLPPL